MSDDMIRRHAFAAMQELLQVHELPVRREEARGEVHGRPGDAGRHVRGPAPARPAAALPAPPVGVGGPVRRGGGGGKEEEAGQKPLPGGVISRPRARKRRGGRLAAERRPPDDVRRRRGGAGKRARGGRRGAPAPGGGRGLVRRRLDRLRAGCYRADLRLAAYDLVLPRLPLRVVP